MVDGTSFGDEGIRASIFQHVTPALAACNPVNCIGLRAMIAGIEQTGFTPVVCNLFIAAPPSHSHQLFLQVRQFREVGRGEAGEVERDEVIVHGLRILGQGGEGQSPKRKTAAKRPPFSCQKVVYAVLAAAAPRKAETSKAEAEDREHTRFGNFGRGAEEVEAKVGKIVGRQELNVNCIDQRKVDSSAKACIFEFQGGPANRARRWKS